MTHPATHTARLESSADRWIGGALVTAFVAGVIVLLVPPLTQFVPPCPFRAATGLYCPGCGTGRAIQALGSGDVLGAIRMNVLAVILLGPALYGVGRELLVAFGQPAPRAIPVSARWAAIIAIAVIAYWVLRNVPAYPLTLLAPH